MPAGAVTEWGYCPDIQINSNGSFTVDASRCISGLYVGYVYDDYGDYPVVTQNGKPSGYVASGFQILVTEASSSVSDYVYIKPYRVYAAHGDTVTFTVEACGYESSVR